MKFGTGICQVFDDRNLFGVDIKFRELFYLNYQKAIPSSYATDVQNNNQLRTHGIIDTNIWVQEI